MKNCVYILLCKDKKYYIGSTINLENRIKQHRKGRVRSTEKKRPIRLIFYQEFSSKRDANRIELWIKKQKSKILIEQIIQDKEIKKAKIWRV